MNTLKIYYKPVERARKEMRRSIALFPEQFADSSGREVLFPVPVGIELAEDRPVTVGLLPQGDGILVRLAGQFLEQERIGRLKPLKDGRNQGT